MVGTGEAIRLVSGKLHTETHDVGQNVPFNITEHTQDGLMY